MPQNIGGGGFGGAGGGGFKSHEAFLMEQGKLLANDMRLYIAGSHNMSGAAIKFGLGSPPAGEFRIIENGVMPERVMGSDIFHKIFIRRLTAGSVFGE